MVISHIVLKDFGFLVFDSKEIGKNYSSVFVFGFLF